MAVAEGSLSNMHVHWTWLLAQNGPVALCFGPYAGIFTLYMLGRSFLHVASVPCLIAWIDAGILGAVVVIRDSVM